MMLCEERSYLLSEREAGSHGECQSQSFDEESQWAKKRVEHVAAQDLHDEEAP